MLLNLWRERKRAQAVRDLDILGSEREPAFDRFVAAAARAFDAPIALMSLIHDDQQWFKAGHGLVIDCIPRDSGFCSFTLDRPDVFETHDPEHDPRFAHLPVVTDEPHVRYYIGAPLRRVSGIDVGALCVLDTKRRAPASADQKAYLVGLARQASTAMENRLDLLRRGAAA
ncbi:GAF domain-containing protein [Sphingomonas sp. RIT328]|uniref:GAF domain-containing protein n=1 Tax=Sphingomonas sp. RIT328 TaxID=1470591 RepID=UPI00045134A5|nr:GAF domain-containing protein [Sphingomonas sp. RIT328]EZP53684.1 Sensory box histidine kinase/response regulator [Sphingomonas sp. RIT328]EZP53725.1 Sensory box histidine kinase/response regulator [Sphingomonas sp. RIT328]